MLDLGSESTISIDGKDWRVSRVTISVITAFRDWIREQIGDPFAKIDRVKAYLQPADIVARVKEAESILEQLESFSLSCPLAERFLTTETGGAKLWQLLLAKYNPNATLDDGMAVLLAKGKEKQTADAALARAKGTVPGPNGASQGQSPGLLTGATSSAA